MVLLWWAERRELVWKRMSADVASHMQVLFSETEVSRHGIIRLLIRLEQLHKDLGLAQNLRDLHFLVISMFLRYLSDFFDLYCSLFVELSTLTPADGWSGLRGVTEFGGVMALQTAVGSLLAESEGTVRLRGKKSPGRATVTTNAFLVTTGLQQLFQVNRHLVLYGLRLQESRRRLTEIRAALSEFREISGWSQTDISLHFLQRFYSLLSNL